MFAFPQIVTTEPARAKFPSEDDPEEEEEAEAEGTGADADAAEAADSNDAADANASGGERGGTGQARAPLERYRDGAPDSRGV